MQLFLKMVFSKSRKTWEETRATQPSKNNPEKIAVLTVKQNNFYESSKMMVGSAM